MSNGFLYLHEDVQPEIAKEFTVSFWMYPTPNVLPSREIIQHNLTQDEITSLLEEGNQFPAHSDLFGKDVLNVLTASQSRYLDSIAQKRSDAQNQIQKINNPLRCLFLKYQTMGIFYDVNANLIRVSVRTTNSSDIEFSGSIDSGNE